MSKRAGSELHSGGRKNTSIGQSVVDLAGARVRLRPGHPSKESSEELDEVRSLLDQGLTTEALSRLASLISTARNNPKILALAR